MAENRLISYVSSGIARTNPFEGGPAFEAWRQGRSVIASTWGDYVSRLGESLDGGEPLEVLLGKLCITTDELQNSQIQFTRREEFDKYRYHFEKATFAEATEYYAPEVKRLEMTLDAIADGYRLPDQDAANAEADDAQTKINAISIAFRAGGAHNEQEIQDNGITQTELSMRRDALRSGTLIPLAEFVETMLQVNLIHDGDFKSELAKAWVRSVNLAIESFFFNWQYAFDMPVSKIVVGGEAFSDMRRGLSHLYAEQKAHKNERWAEVAPIFLTDYMASHPLISHE